MAEKKPLKLYRIEVDGSTYYGTGEDAYNAYAKVVAHYDREGNYVHKNDLDLAVTVEQVDVASESFIAWSLTTS